jgi:hypothetical protein
VESLAVEATVTSDEDNDDNDDDDDATDDDNATAPVVLVPVLDKISISK